MAYKHFYKYQLRKKKDHIKMMYDIINSKLKNTIMLTAYKF